MLKVVLPDEEAEEIKDRLNQIADSFGNEAFAEAIVRFSKITELISDRSVAVYCERKSYC